MGFSIDHQVRFHETDAAGVLYFAHGLALCHTAYEDSLQAVGINLSDFFRAAAEIAYPIIHTSMDYRRPMHCGDRVTISLQPTRLDISTFEISYSLSQQSDQAVLLAQALTRHVCIDTQSRTRLPLPAPMEDWLKRWAD
ncbi:MAG TPA: acyl-CoA thioesterase [Leptolyngbyaceae cyanobacterium M65_K2018_010]|nr:acyl-CoA thioesterase [Leptolyngbyaceae cyanobacterium M65_K2018_010]